MMSNEVTFWGKNPGLGEFCGGQGRDRTVDRPIFSRTLVPTELPGQQVRISPN